METALTTWLNMVFAALSDQDHARREVRLREAQSFLEESRLRKQAVN